MVPDTDAEIPQCSGDVLGDEPDEWPGAPDVFRDLASIAAREAKGYYENNGDLQNAVIYGVSKVLDKWVNYSGETEETAHELLYDYLLHEVFEARFTRFNFDPQLTHAIG